MTISFELGEEGRMVQESVSGFARGLREHHRAFEEAGDVPQALRKQFFDLGLATASLPEAAGGAPLDEVLVMVINEALGEGDLGASASLQGLEGFVEAVSAFGTTEQQQRFLAPLTRREAATEVAAVAFSEGVSDVAEGLSTAAILGDKGVWRLSGEKRFVCFAPKASRWVIFAQTDASAGWSGVSAFVVEGRPEGLTVAETDRKLGLITMPSANIHLENVEVPESHKLAVDALSLRRFFARMSLRNAARLVGCMKAASDYALDYTQNRSAFGKPIAHFQAIAFKHAELATDVEGARWSLWMAADAMERGKKTAYRETAAAVATVHELAMAATDDAVQLLGGLGYMQDAPVEKWMRDVRTASLCYGSTELWNHVTAVEAMRLGAEVPLSELIPVPQLQAVYT